MTKLPVFKRGRGWAAGFLLLGLVAGNVFGQNGKVEVTPPDWLRNGVVYEIYPRNFSKEGNFNGVTARLDELKALGVNILWLMPIHPIGEKLRKGCCGSPYAVKDYYAINPDYGTEGDLKRLVSEAHRRGLKVIMDMVVNHTAWDSVLMKHPEFYKQDAQGNIQPPVAEWTDVAGLNYNNAELRRYMITLFKYWIDPAGFDLDGYRCDVAEMVPTGFWEEARAEMLKVKPDIMLLAEASKPELMARAFDVDYGWPLMHALNNVIEHGAPATECGVRGRNRGRGFPREPCTCASATTMTRPAPWRATVGKGRWRPPPSCSRSMACPCYTMGWKWETRPNPATRPSSRNCPSSGVPRTVRR